MKKKLDLKKFKYQKEKAEKFYKDLNFKLKKIHQKDEFFKYYLATV